jgi:hypothetical protein
MMSWVNYHLNHLLDKNMKTKILMILPTRGRPARLLEAVASFERTQTGFADLLLVCNANDPELVTVRTQNQESRCHIMTIVGPQLGMVPEFSNHAMAFAEQYEMIGLAANDLIFETKGWDAMVLQAEKGQPSVVYGNDLIQGRDLGTHPFFSTSIIRQLGYAGPPGLKHLYLDSSWMAIGRAINRLIYLPQVITRHVHGSVHTELWDEGYAFANSPTMCAEDKATYENFVKSVLPHTTLCLPS